MPAQRQALMNFAHLAEQISVIVFQLILGQGNHYGASN